MSDDLARASAAMYLIGGSPPVVSEELLGQLDREIVAEIQSEVPPSEIMARKPELRAQIEQVAYRALSRGLARRGNLSLPRERQDQLVRSIVNRIAGLGVLEQYLPPHRADLEEICLTPDGRMWLSVHGQSGWSEDRAFRCSADEAKNAALKILELIGRSVNLMHPVEDGRIPRSGTMASGARFNVALPPVASGQFPSLNIRFWSQAMPTLEDLLRWRTLDQPMADFLTRAVQGHSNIVVAGGTKTGKTTVLNILCQYIPEGERIVTVEDTQELRIGPGYNWTAMESRPSNMEGEGEVPLGYLVRNALRQSPTWLIPGEIRDGEAAYQAMRAMSTGHYGMTTVHTDSAYDTPRQIVNLAQGDGYYAGNKEAAKERFAAAFRLVVHIGMLPGQTRRVVTRICEVQPQLRKGDVYLRELFRYDVTADVWQHVADPQWLGQLAWEYSRAEEES